MLLLCLEAVLGITRWTDVSEIRAGYCRPSLTVCLPVHSAAQMPGSSKQLLALTSHSVVISLYPAEEAKIEVEIKAEHGKLNCDFPAHSKDDGLYKLTAKSDGSFVYSDSKQYHQLFYDLTLDSKALGESSADSKFAADIDATKAFCVSSADACTFLERAADAYLLNTKEAADFITFVLPRMEMSPWTLIEFCPARYLQHIPLRVSPKPDVMIRLLVLMRALESAVECGLDAAKSTFPQCPSERKGFVVCEWGAVDLDDNAWHIA